MKPIISLSASATVYLHSKQILPECNNSHRNFDFQKESNFAVIKQSTNKKVVKTRRQEDFSLIFRILFQLPSLRPVPRVATFCHWKQRHKNILQTYVNYPLTLTDSVYNYSILECQRELHNTVLTHSRCRFLLAKKGRTKEHKCKQMLFCSFAHLFL